MTPNYKLAEHTAKKIWQNLCLISPPVPILEVADFFGLTIQGASFEEYPDISGVLDLEEHKIYLNEKDSPEHKRFTIAHEIGHWALHKDQLQYNPNMAIYYRRPIGGESDAKEKEANCFAASLLVPLELLKELSVKFSIKDLAQIFAVSTQVIRYRLKSLQMHYGLK